MAKKKKAQETKEKDKSVVFRITVTHGLEIRDYLVTADYYEVDRDRDDTVHLYKLETEQIASFRHWIAIENLKAAEEWGERFEKLANISPDQCDMFESDSCPN